MSAQEATSTMPGPRHRRAFGMLALASAALALPAAPAQAAILATLTFDQPDATTTASAAIPIFATLTLDAASDALSVVDNAIVTGISDQEILDAGGDPAMGIRFVSQSMVCSSGTATNLFIGGDCGSGPYDLQFGSGTGTFGGTYALTAGQSISLLFATFLPKGGAAPAGTYSFAGIGLDFLYSGQDMNGQPLSASFGAATTDPALFTRLVGVTAVPEPASWALMIGGFGMIGASARRRIRRTAEAS